MILASSDCRSSAGTVTAARRVEVLEMAGPAARAAAAEPVGPITAVYRSTLTVRCGTTPVNVGGTPVQAVCSMRVRPAELAGLRALPVGTPLHLDIRRALSQPMRLEARGMPAAFEPTICGTGASWFDSPPGRRFGRARLTAAAQALAADREPDALLALCGLGIGLTPSGDDALIGMFALAQCAGIARSCQAGCARRLTDGLSTDVSLCHLRLALGGEFSRPVTGLLDVLVARDSSRREIRYATEAVARIGHSSGADLLAGMAALHTELTGGEERR
ncbi:Protein of unknown function [Propionibacterium cyclohexanicum]|uniref:DUF2877 domain-containing protein n=1 Tax=Propionibacterium cyclohexanicum TaxID=64702 RepID=A0A1H9SI23_9ACTN|nr:DUF2877 domain-containing protein [Propionibacterium cyclohexanicum]SER84601.1 Protein of unknown function [Propionibacterium cyclohexanicum]